MMTLLMLLGLLQADPITQLTQALNMSPAQTESFRKIAMQHNEALQPVLQTLRSRQEETRRLQDSGQDATRLAAATAAMRKSEEQLRAIETKYRADVNAILTPAQRQKVAEAQAAAKLVGPLSMMGLIDMPGMRGPGPGPRGPGPRRP
jgi:Spy/CpxP family protein refolding chaperone